MFGQLTTSLSSVFQSDIAEGTKEDMNLVVLQKVIILRSLGNKSGRSFERGQRGFWACSCSAPIMEPPFLKS